MTRKGQKKQHRRKGARKEAPSRAAPKEARKEHSMLLGPFLAKLFDQFHHSHWIVSDPIQYAHRYSKPDDQEIAAFVASCFAYGSVQLVHRAVEAILRPMAENPGSFVRNYDGSNHWPGFYHRFHHEDHVMILVGILRDLLTTYGSLGEFFHQASKGTLSCENVLNEAALILRRAAVTEVERRAQPELLRGMKFLFNAPADGSACKRMTMFLRWMVRQDEVDLGLWKWMSPSDLVIPADTHVARISFYLGLRGGNEHQSANWRMAKEITESLKKICPEDPVRYDFALARLGILDICKREYSKSICELCPVEPGCRFSNMKGAKNT